MEAAAAAVWFKAAAAFIYLSEGECLIWFQSSGQHWVQGPALLTAQSCMKL